MNLCFIQTPITKGLYVHGKIKHDEELSHHIRGFQKLTDMFWNRYSQSKGGNCTGEEHYSDKIFHCHAPEVIKVTQ